MSKKGNNNDEAHSKRPANTAFKQQRLRAWQPILTPKPVILAFLIVGIVFIPIGAGIVLSSGKVVEVDTRYDNSCTVGTTCYINFTVSKDMQPPVYAYYRLENFYQNHRRYVKSRNDFQLQGQSVSYSDLTDCDPYISVNSTSNPMYFYVPCGLIARSVFNDTFTLYDGSGNPVSMRKNGIAWPSDKQKKFRNPPSNGQGIRIIPDFEDEDFIVWMRTAGLPDFKKLYRIIDTVVPAGTYSFRVRDNFPVNSFGGKKHFVLSTTTWIGGKNPFLGFAYIAVGAVCLIQGIFFALRHKFAPRKLGDTKYLEWNK